MGPTSTAAIADRIAAGGALAAGIGAVTVGTLPPSGPTSAGDNSPIGDASNHGDTEVVPSHPCSRATSYSPYRWLSPTRQC